MRIYEGSPRTDFEEVLRSIGAFVDHRGMRDVLVLEAPDGFVLQGLVHSGASSSAWSDSVGAIEKETLTFLDEDIAKFMDEAVARRGAGATPGAPGSSGRYEDAFRVIGRYIDEQRPHDMFFFEQDGAFVVRLHHIGQTGTRHTLTEFLPDDVAQLIAQGPGHRAPIVPPGKPGQSR